MVWFEDKQILSEIVIMRGVEPARWNTPLPLSVGKTRPLTPPTMDATGDATPNHTVNHPRGASLMMSLADILQLVVLCALLFFRWLPDAPLSAPDPHDVKTDVL